MVADYYNELYQVIFIAWLNDYKLNYQLKMEYRDIITLEHYINKSNLPLFTTRNGN